MHWLAEKNEKSQTLWLLFIEQCMNSTHKSHKRVPKKKKEEKEKKNAKRQTQTPNPNVALVLTWSHREV